MGGGGETRKIVVLPRFYREFTSWRDRERGGGDPKNYGSGDMKWAVAKRKKAVGVFLLDNSQRECTDNLFPTEILARISGGV